ncbi:hypothetical protein [Pseudomonas sp. BBP2017]|uniref:hypothetical protein n=1 Tax=Pseudomonas sp. BBP2017 TaxID=2109731 RepID=UPI000D132BD5|nr:hypothetical protein [Pseudomonas sp. BBP2017]PSS58943.1 hypothetical protein C6382_00810 [Pseudomonas sp. BBP2017]
MLLRPLDIIARHRTAELVAVRWSFAEEYWPRGGFEVTRELDGQSSVIAGIGQLPGGVERAQGQWDIDPQQLEADWTARGTEVSGPPLPSLVEALALRPALVFALPDADPAALDRELKEMARIAGQSHASDEGLDLKHWRGAPPSMDDLLAMRGGTPDQQRTYHDVIMHYQRHAPILLLALATEFGVARFLGLGVEDRPLHAPARSLRYRVAADYRGRPANWDCEAAPIDAASPPPPAAPTLTPAAPEFVLYPAFGRFFAGAAWQPVMAAGPDPLLVERTAVAMTPVRSVATPTALIEWVGPGEDAPCEREVIPQLSSLAVSWAIERHSFGAGHAQEDVPPAPGVANFVSVHLGERIIEQGDNSFLDSREIPLGEPPYDGWHSYRISGRDLLGFDGPWSDEATIEMRDPAAPPPPLVRFDTEIVVFKASGDTALVHLDWGAEQELVAPDAALFQIRQLWQCDCYHPLVIAPLLAPPDGPPPLRDDLNIVQAQIRVTDDGREIPKVELELLIGGTLVQGGVAFAILAAPGDSTLIVRRSAGRDPLAGDAQARIGISTPVRNVIAEDVRTPAVAAHVEVRTAAPLTVSLYHRTVNPGTGGVTDSLIPPENGVVYLHLPGLNFRAEPSQNGAAFVLALPDGAGPASKAMLEAMDKLSAAEFAAWLDASPALWLPAHSTALALDPPEGFVSGRVQLEVRAVDCHGKEGNPRQASAPARLIAAPATVRIPWVPRIWAHDAAEYAETARARISWPEMAGAMRYEIERAIEPALGLTPQSADETLLDEAARQGAAFERISDAAIYPRFEDLLPGRAPTRAVYRVRGVSASGMAGDWLIVALVWVPDVRIAPQPVPLGARPDPGRERAVICSWTQPGPVEGIGFRIEARPVLQGQVRDEDWTVVSELVPGSVAPVGAGRYTVTLQDRAPGFWQDYRVTAVRHALDPDDPRGRAIRRIMGAPSDPMRACAEGDLRPPEYLRANVSDTGVVTLRWTKRDRYQAIEVRRWEEGDWRVVRVTLPGEAETYVVPDRLPADTVWLFDLTAIGHDARPRCGPVSVRRAEP